MAIRTFFASIVEYHDYLKNNMTQFEHHIHDTSLEASGFPSDYHCCTSGSDDPENPNPSWRAIKRSVEKRLYGVNEGTMTGDVTSDIPF